MASQINHVAIMSESFAMVAQFYQAVFGFQPPPKQTNFGAITVGDGYTGVNINPRRPGRPARLDHFGIQVDDVDAVLDTFKSKYPAVHVLKRPANRPFAGLTTHDPDGNIFDLSQIRMENRSEIYKATENKGGWTQDRVITHFGIRTLNPEKMAEFYVDALGLSLANRAPGDPNYYVTDGRMTLVILKPEGQAVLKDMWAVYGKRIEAVLGEALDLREQRRLLQVLERIERTLHAT